jgi:hypothetical protein
MKRFRWLLIFWVLSLGHSAARAEELPRVGMQLDVGLPGAAGATLVYRPLGWLRANGGLAYDYVGYGARAGLTLAPFRAIVTPTLGIDAGHYFTGDASNLVATSDAAKQELLHNAVYDFATVHLGLELGSQRRFSFYVHAGISYVAATAHGASLSALVNEHIQDPTLVVRVDDAHVRALIPSVSVGFNIFFK